MENNKNGFGIASLILGILSIVFSVWWGIIGIVCGILGIIFAVKQRKRHPNSIATAGLVTSIVGLVLSFIVFIILVLILGAAFLALA